MPSPWSLSFPWDELLVVAALSGGYALAVREYGASRARIAAFAASQLLIVAIFVSPIEVLSLNYLLSAHLFQNVALAEWAPALAVLGLSAAMAGRLARFRPIRVLTHAFVALPLWLATYAVWHVPALYDAALRHHALLHLEHAMYFGTGVALWWPVFQDEPHRLSAARRAIYVFAAFLLASPVGLFLTLLPNPIYDFYESAPRIWGIDPLADQQIAGVIMTGSEMVVFFAVFALFVNRFFTEEDAPSPLGHRTGDSG